MRSPVAIELGEDVCTTYAGALTPKPSAAWSGACVSEISSDTGGPSPFGGASHPRDPIEPDRAALSRFGGSGHDFGRTRSSWPSSWATRSTWRSGPA